MPDAARPGLPGLWYETRSRKLWSAKVVMPTPIAGTLARVRTCARSEPDNASSSASSGLKVMADARNESDYFIVTGDWPTGPAIRPISRRILQACSTIPGTNSATFIRSLIAPAI